MISSTVFYWLLIGWFGLGAVVFILLFFVNAPYGRYFHKGLGPDMNNKLGWLVMESGASLLFAYIFFKNTPQGTVLWIFLLMWEVHYFHRAFLYPINLKGPSKRIPLLIVVSGLSFNLINAYLNGHYLFSLSGGYPNSWLLDARFIGGFLLFSTGFVINRQSDMILGQLKHASTGYVIPQGGLFYQVSCPNYLGEITIWIGWALATWSFPGLVFAFWTTANLVPRARATHAWYRSHFPNYPEDRKALLPGIW